MQLSRLHIWLNVGWKWEITEWGKKLPPLQPSLLKVNEEDIYYYFYEKGNF